MNKTIIELNELTKVQSSNIDMIGFQDKTTYVVFKNGGIYSYNDTTKEEFEDLRKAESVGSFFAKTYRNKENYVKLEHVELRKKKLSAEELESKIINMLRVLPPEFKDSSTSFQRMYAQDIIKLVKENV